MTDFEKLISGLKKNRVDFIIVGGAAAVAHGSARLTQDLDIVYRRDKGNLTRLVKSLTPHKPYLRGAPRGLPFIFDEVTLKNGLNFTLTTTIGDIDLLGEVVGGGNFESLEKYTVKLDLFGFKCLCINLEKLIDLKRSAGRPKDLEAIAELMALRDLKPKP